MNCSRITWARPAIGEFSGQLVISCKPGAAYGLRIELEKHFVINAIVKSPNSIAYLVIGSKSKIAEILNVTKRPKSDKIPY